MPCGAHRLYSVLIHLREYYHYSTTPIHYRDLSDITKLSERSLSVLDKKLIEYSLIQELDCATGKHRYHLSKQEILDTNTSNTNNEIILDMFSNMEHETMPDEDTGILHYSFSYLGMLNKLCEVSFATHRFYDVLNYLRPTNNFRTFTLTYKEIAKYSNLSMRRLYDFSDALCEIGLIKKNEIKPKRYGRQISISFNQTGAMRETN